MKQKKLIVDCQIGQKNNKPPRPKRFNKPKQFKLLRPLVSTIAFVATTFFNPKATNINNLFDITTAMSQQVQQPPLTVEEVQRQASLAADNLRDFFLTGNIQNFRQFLAIYNSQTFDGRTLSEDQQFRVVLSNAFLGNRVVANPIIVEFIDAFRNDERLSYIRRAQIPPSSNLEHFANFDRFISAINNFVQHLDLVANGSLSLSELKRNCGQELTRKLLVAMPDQSARIALRFLRDFILTTDQSKKTDFDTVINLFRNLPAGHASQTQFILSIQSRTESDLRLNPPLIGHIFSAYSDQNSVTLSSLATAIDSVYRAAHTIDSQNLSQQINQLRQQYPPDFVNSLLGVYAANRFQEFVRTTDATIRTRAWENLNVVLSSCREGEGFVTGFMPAFFDALGSDPEYQAIWSAYPQLRTVRDGRSVPNQNPNNAQFASFLDQLNVIIRQLRAPGTNVVPRLQGAYDPTFVSAVQAVVGISIEEEEAPAEITQDDLFRRVQEVEQFIRRRNLLMTAFGPRLYEWRTQLANPRLSRENLIEINSSIPTAQMLEELDHDISRAETALNRLLSSSPDGFYWNIGPRVWLPRLRTLFASLNSMQTDPIRGSFATDLMRLHNIDLGQLNTLINLVTGAHNDIPAALLTLDQAIRNATPSLAVGLGAEVTVAFNLISSRIVQVTDHLAQLRGVDRTNSATMASLRLEVERRLLGPYVVVDNSPAAASASPLAGLRQNYRDMIAGGVLPNRTTFVRFIQTTFPTALAVYIEGLSRSASAASSPSAGAAFAETQAVAPTTESERYLVNSRLDIARRAQTALESLPMIYLQGVYQLLESTYGPNWPTLLNSPDQMARICSLIIGFADIPPAYAARLMSTIGRRLLVEYDDSSIALIGSYIAGHTRMFVLGDRYDRLLAYYDTLPEKLSRLFTDITAIQRASREPTYDVRPRMPPEDPSFATIFIPAMNIFVRIPKHIYETPDFQGFIQRFTAPNLAAGPAAAPDMARVMSVMFDRSMIEGRLNVPYPLVTLPILLQNIGALAPDEFVPVGDYLSATGEFFNSLRYYQLTRREGTAGRIFDDRWALDSIGRVTTQFLREGATSTGSVTYNLSTGSGVNTVNRGVIEGTNWRIAPGPQGVRGYNIHTGRFNFELLGDRLQTLSAFFSAAAPAGADTLSYLQYDAVNERLNAHFFQRLANGSFALFDTISLTREQAGQLYERVFRGPLQRIYGAVRAEHGNVLAQLDGALLFGGIGPGATRSDSIPGQGIGGAGQIGEWGGYVDYENTRNQRFANAFGRFMRTSRAYWVGRVSGENLSIDERGRRRLYANFAYSEIDSNTNTSTQINAFLGAPIGRGAEQEHPWYEQIQGAATINARLSRNFLGHRYIGAGGGRLHRELRGGQDSETLAGGRVYGISYNLINALVASVLYRDYSTSVMQSATAPPSMGPTQRPTRDTFVPGTGLPEQMPLDQETRERILRDHPELRSEQQEALRRARTAQEAFIISGGLRRIFARIFNVELGAGWDSINQNQRGAFLSFDWAPMGGTIGSLGLRAAVVNNSGQPMAIVGVTGEGVIGETRAIAEAFTVGQPVTDEGVLPRAGELRLRSRFLDLAGGGGYIPTLTPGGAHGAVRVRLAPRLHLFAAGTYAQERASTNLNTLLRSGEGMVGIMSVSGVAGPASTLRTYSLALSGMVQNAGTPDQQPTRLSIVSADSAQFDLRGAFRSIAATHTLSAALGAQYWRTTWPDPNTASREARERFALTGDVAYQERSWRALTFRLRVSAGLVTRDFFDTPRGQRVDETQLDINGQATFSLNF